MTEWREFKIKDIADVVGGGTPSTAINEYWNGDIPWLTPKDLTGYIRNFISHGERFITKKGLENSSARLLPKGTVLLTSRAPIGYVAIAENEICTNQGFKSLVPNPDKAHNLFLLYWIKSNVEYLQSIGTGTTFQEISGSVLKDVDIILPPLPEQKAIAEVLSSLDDKIDLLTRQNKTLEDVAQVYFRKWFGEGEQIARMGDFFPVKTGKKDANIATDDGKYLFFTCSKEPLRTDSYSFDESSILLAGNGDFNVKWYRGKFEAYQRTYVLTPYDPDDMPWLYFVISNSLNELTTGYRGSVINFITKGMIEDYKVTLPTTENFIKFKKLACEIIDKQEFNNKQISILHKLRDTLLPKLISGEIRVKM